MSSPARSFFAANAFLLVTLGIGLLNNILVAALFGLTEQVDAFFAAMVLPTLFMTLCIDYLGKNFLPVFAAARLESADIASEMTSNVIVVVSVLALVVMALFLTFGETIFGLLLPGFDADTLALVNDYFTIMAPSMALMAATTFHEYVCQFDERYVTVVRIRTGLPLMNLVCLLALAPTLGAYSLPIGYTAGHVVVFLLMARSARYRFRPRLALRAHLEGKVFSNSAIVMSTGILARSKSLFVNYFASQLGGGVISAIALATKLSEPVQRGAFYAARMIMFSRTARLHSEGDVRAMVELYEFGVRTGFLLLAPLLWWAGLHADTLVDVIFGHGAFTDAMVDRAGSVLVPLIPAVLLLGVSQLLSNAFYAMDRVAVPAIVMPLVTLAYAIAAGPISSRLGPPGLTLTTSIVSLAMFLALVVMLARSLPGFRTGRLLAAITAYSLVAGLWMAGAATMAGTLGMRGIAAAAVTLLTGTLLYAGSLLLARDLTLLRIVAVSRGMLGGVP